MSMRILFSVLVAIVAGCSLVASSHPSVQPGKYCWVFPGYGKLCAESEDALIRLRSRLLPPVDAGQP